MTPPAPPLPEAFPATLVAGTPAAPSLPARRKGGRDLFLELARRGARLPIGTELVLAEQRDPAAVKLDGARLGQVVAESAKRWGSPIAIPLMDLTLEKEWLLGALGVPASGVATHHFRDPVPSSMPEVPLSGRLRANADAIRWVNRHTDFFACGMSIGPFSLMTKLVADPIGAVYLAGAGERDAEVERMEAALRVARQVVLRSVCAQIDAGARAVIVCEPAANVTYFSPRQLAAGSDVFERCVMEPNRALAELLRACGAELVFHDCGELTDDMVRSFATLRPGMLSLGSSRRLWQDAALLPKDVVLYGNLPSKQFYSDEVISLDAVRERARDLDARMRRAEHPFILGSECDVLSVPGCEERIRSKVEAFLSA
jgi:uroporphyrinogen-III decarboxylase